MTEKTAKAGRGFGPYMGLTFLIGFGFFTMGLMDSLYDTYVPKFLTVHLTAIAATVPSLPVKFLTGLIMTLDNILQLALIPLVMVWSDRTRTRMGRRLPFIVVMLPTSALLFAFMPDASALSLTALIVLLFVFNIFKTSVRGPVVALMPDTIPGDYRSEANGVINTMGGLGLIIGTLGLALLMDLDTVLPLYGRTLGRIPFPIASVFIVLAVLVLVLFVREKSADAEEPAPPLGASLKAVFAAADKSVLRILLSIFFWFMAYEGVKPFLGLYMTDQLGVSQGKAALAMGVAGIAGVLVAIPTGYLAHKFGRRNYIRACLLALAAILAVIVVTGPIAKALKLNELQSLILFLLLMFLYGMVWIGVVVNSFPMLWQMASFGTIGMFTGLYYLFSQSAAIASPPLTGLIIDLAGYPGIFLFGAACMVIAWLIMAGVKQGEAKAK